MSGYTADVIAQHGVLDNTVHFIQKPFSIQELAAKIRTTLEGMNHPPHAVIVKRLIPLGCFSTLICVGISPASRLT